MFNSSDKRRNQKKIYETIQQNVHKFELERPKFVSEIRTITFCQNEKKRSLHMKPFLLDLIYTLGSVRLKVGTEEA
jgi:hypothetical protein